MEEKIICAYCGEVIEDEYDSVYVGDEIYCRDCIDEHFTTCDCCDEYVFEEDDYGNDGICLCRDCYRSHYDTCHNCNSLIHEDDFHWYDDHIYCASCYDEVCGAIEDYSYKPEPVFYGKDSMFLGVELEIDEGGKDNCNAERIKDIANIRKEHIYIKSDGSLDDGMEIVSHGFVNSFV